HEKGGANRRSVSETAERQFEREQPERERERVVLDAARHRQEHRIQRQNAHSRDAGPGSSGQPTDQRTEHSYGEGELRHSGEAKARVRAAITGVNVSRSTEPPKISNRRDRRGGSADPRSRPRAFTGADTRRGR